MARAGAHRGHGATRGAALAASTVSVDEGYAASAVTRTSTVAECAEGGRREANGARHTPRGRGAALHESPTAVGGAGVKGRFVQRRWRRAECAAHGSLLQRCEGETRHRLGRSNRPKT